METVLITGTSKGIGLELTRQFLERGCNVIATYRGQPSNQLESLLGNKTLTLAELEVTDPQSIDALLTQLGDRQIDVLINNAGVFGPAEQTVDALDPQAWLDTFAVNTIAPLMVSRAVLKQMAHATNPRIVTISSQMGALNREGVGMLAYRSSKAALNKAMQVLSLELKEKGVIVCPVHPGWVQTDMGGAAADITVEESATGIADLVFDLNMQQSGKFWTWQGKEHVW